MLTASVPPGVTGKVTFYDGITMLGTATISGQSASRSSILIPAGARRLTALYTGDGSHPASRSNVVAQTVTQTPNSSFSLGSPTFVGGTYRFGPTGGAIGDFNGDGIADLAVGNLTGLEQGSISVVPGNGDGTFGSPSTIQISVHLRHSPLAILMGTV
ncbi:MAG: Ig-like domain repeat protein [Ignavibacteriota bacterium]